MIRAANNNQVLSLAFFVILLVSLGAAGTSLGLLQANINNGIYSRCHFFITYTQAMNSSLLNYNLPTCKLSIASATIATICLALLTAIELISVSFQINVKRLIANIIQAGFFVGSILFLFITMIVVSAGWGKTCATYRNITSSGGTPRSLFNIDCTGPQYRSSVGPFAPNGADFITAAKCSGVANVLAIITLSFFVAKRIRSRLSDEYTPLIKINDYELT
uniref:MARVEL domain-containing protein n=1 Tax=Amphimedon queenslandica TaxID=400682 RepID=A0A1X7U4Y6_AMPQE